LAGAVFLGLGVVQAWRDSPTFDEPVYLAAGLSSLTTHDLRINPEHPPLGKALAALPALAAHPVIPKTAAWHEGKERVYSAQFVQAQIQAGKLQRVMFLGRLVPLLEALAVAAVLYVLGRKLFGRAAGVTAALLWLAGPLVLGLGHLNGIDLPFTLATALVALALVRVLEVDRVSSSDGPAGLRHNWTRLVLLGVAGTIAATTKATGLLLVALVVAVVFVTGWRSRRWRSLLDAAVVGVVAWVGIWVVYAVIAPRSVWPPGLLPQDYITGLRYLGSNDTSPGPGYLLGHYWTGGRWWYWPVSLVVKLPLPTLLLMLAAPLGVLAARRGAQRRTVAAIVLPAVVITAFTVPGPRDIGIRYLLPVLALWLVPAAALASVAVTGSRRVRVGVVAVLVATSAAFTVASAPHSLAWTAPPFRPGYRVATNSNVDWGQDLYRLQRWTAGRDAAVAYFGPRGITTAGTGGTRNLLAVPPSQLTGWAAASATLLNSEAHASLSWLRAYCPLGTIGGTILLYRFDRPPSSAPGPDRPAALCPAGTRFSERQPARRTG
jgi:4-amino-4-deoxy-L-arabinose transferase-like glycosyltransferase